MLSGYKTYILAGLAALGSAYLAIQSGTFNPNEAITVLNSLALMALRAALVNGKPTA